MVDPSVERSTRKYLRLILDHGIVVRFEVVFGSHVNGRPDCWSDIDVLVVSPQFDGPRYRRDIDLLWLWRHRRIAGLNRSPAVRCNGWKILPAPWWRSPAGKVKQSVLTNSNAGPRYGLPQSLSLLGVKDFLHQEVELARS